MRCVILSVWLTSLQIEPRPLRQHEPIQDSPEYFRHGRCALRCRLCICVWESEVLRAWRMPRKWFGIFPFQCSKLIPLFIFMSVKLYVKWKMILLKINWSSKFLFWKFYIIIMTKSPNKKGTSKNVAFNMGRDWLSGISTEIRNAFIRFWHGDNSRKVPGIARDIH